MVFVYGCRIAIATFLVENDLVNGYNIPLPGPLRFTGISGEDIG